MTLPLRLITRIPFDARVLGGRLGRPIRLLGIHSVRNVKLEEVISRVGIPVPIGIAFNDDKHMAKNLIDAIKAAVVVHDAAGRLVLEPAPARRPQHFRGDDR